MALVHSAERTHQTIIITAWATAWSGYVLGQQIFIHIYTYSSQITLTAGRQTALVKSKWGKCQWAVWCVLCSGSNLTIIVDPELHLNILFGRQDLGQTDVSVLTVQYSTGAGWGGPRQYIEYLQIMFWGRRSDRWRGHFPPPSSSNPTIIKQTFGT